MDTAVIERIQAKFKALRPVMDERMRRQWAATEAMALGWGGISGVSQATGFSRNTIALGIRELEQRQTLPDTPPASRLRQPGAGRKPVTKIYPGI
jgi:hypothetical protein